MKVYKRSFWSVCKLLLLAPIATVLSYFMAGFLSYNEYVRFVVPPIVFLLLLFIALVGERMRIELFEDGRFRYMYRSKLEYECALKDCKIGRIQRGKQGALGGHDTRLRILPDGQEEETQIDCSALHAVKAQELYLEMLAYAAGELPLPSDL